MAIKDWKEAASSLDLVSFYVLELTLVLIKLIRTALKPWSAFNTAIIRLQDAV